MAINFEEYDKYSIKGKIIDMNDSSTLTISVTSPFISEISEIKFHCNSEHYDTLHPPASPKYDWIDWGGDDAPPIAVKASASYNTKEKCFYKKESGLASRWKRTDFEDIYNDNPNLLRKNMNMQEKYKFFLYKYMSILHKEQLCHFSAYAIDSIDRNPRFINSNQVKRHPGDYFWIYDPDTFHGEKWDAESIDDLVKEIRPSKDCLGQLLEAYKADDRDVQKEKWRRGWKTIKSTPERLQNWLTKYDKIWYILTSSLVGALVTLIVSSIINRNG
jgi:hypothetical protein